jgi:cell division protein FtsB
MKRPRTKMTPREMGTVAGLLLLILWLGTLVIGIYRKEELARETVAGTRAELAALGERRESLSRTVNDLDTERGQEASVRETFGVARPGEEVIIVVPKEELPLPPELTFWQKVKGIFGF